MSAILLGYLRGAVFARVRKLATTFKSFLNPAEIDAALPRLAKAGRVDIRTVGRDAIVLRKEA